MSKGESRPKHSVMYLVLAPVWVAALVLLDQRIKLFAQAELKGTAGNTLIPGILGLRYVENHGMAFGLLQNARIFFIVVTVLVLILFGLIYLAIPEKKRFFPLSAGVILMSAGAIGNFIDRLRLGYVIDYLNLEFISFPVFNLADCFLTWTAVVMAILLVFVYKNDDLEQIRIWKK